MRVQSTQSFVRPVGPSAPRRAAWARRVAFVALCGSPLLGTAAANAQVVAATHASGIARRHAEFPVPGRQLTGTVVDALSGAPIALALVTMPTADRSVLTGVDGRYRFTDLPAGMYTVRVRQIGFAPAELVVRVLDLPAPPPPRTGTDAAARDAFDIRLTRIAVRLDTAYVHGRAGDGACRGRGWASLEGAHPQVAVLFGELRANAERYRLLADRFPLEYRIQRAERFALSSGSAFTQRTDTLLRRSDVRRPYEPGRVFDRAPAFAAASGTATVPVGAEVRVPGFSEMASHAFQAHHCFRYAGVQMFGTRIYYRVDFAPTADLIGPDVEGSLYVDS